MAVGCVGRCRSLVNVHRQSVFTLVSVACAITIGLSLRLRTDPWSEREVKYLKNNFLVKFQNSSFKFIVYHKITYKIK